MARCCCAARSMPVNGRGWRKASTEHKLAYLSPWALMASESTEQSHFLQGCFAWHHKLADTDVEPAQCRQFVWAQAPAGGVVFQVLSWRGSRGIGPALRRVFSIRGPSEHPPEAAEITDALLRHARCAMRWPSA
jgi:hypothetical protein